MYALHAIALRGEDLRKRKCIIEVQNPRRKDFLWQQPRCRRTLPSFNAPKCFMLSGDILTVLHIFAACCCCSLSLPCTLPYRTLLLIRFLYCGRSTLLKFYTFLHIIISTAANVTYGM